MECRDATYDRYFSREKSDTASPCLSHGLAFGRELESSTERFSCAALDFHSPCARQAAATRIRFYSFRRNEINKTLNPFLREKMVLPGSEDSRLVSARMITRYDESHVPALRVEHAESRLTKFHERWKCFKHLWRIVFLFLE